MDVILDNITFYQLIAILYAAVLVIDGIINKRLKNGLILAVVVIAVLALDRWLT